MGRSRIMCMGVEVEQSAVRTLIIGCEGHMDRLITVNLGRQGWACASAPTLESILGAALQLSPTLAVIDDSRIGVDGVRVELVNAGFADIPLMKLSDQKTKPPFTFTSP